MSRKFVINRLDRDELEYELKVRGIGAGTVDEMRHRLSLAIRYEKSGDSLRYPPYPFTFAEDSDVVEKKCGEVKDLIEALDANAGSSEATKIGTKISHLMGRIDRMVPNTSDEAEKREELVTMALTLLDQLEIRVDKLENMARNIDVPVSLNLLEGRLEAQNFQENIQGVPRSSLREDTGESVQCKMIPPHKWGIEKFNGTNKSISITAFFEKVEELSMARNVSKSVLFESGFDLFSDKAYQFYKDCRTRIQSWDELVEEFRQEYLPAYHNDVLFEELKKRTQHPSETIGVYLAVMAGYFGRLRCPISEGAKLSIIMKNLHPYYQDRLREPLPKTINDLRSACRRIEATRDSINNYAEPSSSRRTNVLERDLAYVEISDESDCRQTRLDSTLGSDMQQPQKQTVCWNCNQEGHKAIGCTRPKRIYCYGCKQKGVTKKDCQKCAKGNDLRRS